MVWSEVWNAFVESNYFVVAFHVVLSLGCLAYIAWLEWDFCRKNNHCSETHDE